MEMKMETEMERGDLLHNHLWSLNCVYNLSVFVLVLFCFFFFFFFLCFV